MDASVAEFRNERVPRYLAALLAFLTTLSVFEYAIAAGVTFGYLPAWLGSTREAWTRAAWISLLCLALEVTRRYVRATPRSKRTVLTVETVGTVAACVGVAQMQRVLPDLAVASPTVLMLPVTLILVLRASYVPSTASTTALVGTAASLALMLTTWILSSRNEALLTLVWGAIFTAATALTSNVVYGLRRRVHRAARLGNYQLDRKLGEGGMGEVYLARHALLKRPTAVKLLLRDKVGERAVARFEQEVRQLSRLCHPNTVAIFDYGRRPDGVFFYAMEYLEGINLKQLVEQEGPQAPGRVIHIAAQAAYALAEAHDAGLVHRDVKPANIVLSRRGGVPDLAKVVDFGLVKDVHSPSMDLSSDDVIAGTPLFMAPECVLQPASVDARTDIYALGAVIYYLLAGRFVFEGSSLVEVFGQHIHSPPTPLSFSADVPADLERVVLRCLEKRPEDRFPDARALRDALLDCACSGAWTDAEAHTWWDRFAVAPSRNEASQSKPL